MPIVKLNPDTPILNNQETIPEALSKPNESNFTTLYPEAKVGSLLKYIDGYPWTVNYYNQVINVANTLEHYDPTTPNLNQPYTEVLGMVLQVTSPLSSAYDSSTGITTSYGAAILPYKLKPNVGDIFIAQVDSGEDAIFVVSKVERKTFKKDTLYEVNYSLYKYTSSDPNFTANIKSRVQDTYYFNKDTNYYNRDHLITPTEKEAKDRLVRYLRETQDFYFKRFAQKEAGALLVPGTNASFYDPILLNFLEKVVDFDVKVTHPWFKFHYRDKYIDQDSFYDLLLSRNIGLINTIHKKYGFVSSSSMRNLTRTGSVFHASMDNVIYPKEPDTSLDIDRFNYRSPTQAFVGRDNYVTNKNSIYDIIEIQTKGTTVGTKELLHEMFLDDYYVVSEAFYNYVDDNSTYIYTSFLEVLFLRFIKKEAISKYDLVICLQEYYSWSSLQQLYMLPVLWLIAKSVL